MSGRLYLLWLVGLCVALSIVGIAGYGWLHAIVERIP